jgi:hypothetical protein
MVIEIQHMKIKELTKAQEEMFPHYVKKWVSIGHNTEPTDFEAAIQAAKDIYKSTNLPLPNWFLGPFNTPIEAKLAEQLLQNFVGKPIASNEELNSTIMGLVKKALQTGSRHKLEWTGFNFGAHESWLSFYDYFLQEFNLECCKQLQGWIDMAKCGGWWIPLKNVCIFVHRPEKISMDERNRIHNLNGPAIKFRGDYEGCNVYAVHGVRCSKDIVNKNFTAKDIDNQSNIEVRRVMIDLYGVEKYILDSNSTVVNSDDFGTLYRKENTNDEAIMMVKVVNSTPEPDGSFKDYFIRVDPNAYGGLKTGRAAVASTWRNTDGSMVFTNPNEYDPDIQT